MSETQLQIGERFYHEFLNNLEGYPSNNYKEFIVIDAHWGGGDWKDNWPDAWIVTCCPVENQNVTIRFYQRSDCFKPRLNKVIIL